MRRVPQSPSFVKWTMGILLAASVLATTQAYTDEPIAEDAVAAILSTVEAPHATEEPVLRRGDDGAVTFLGAPPGGVIATGQPGAKSAGYEGIARAYITSHAEAFGLRSAEISFALENIQTYRDWVYVRFQQFYGGIEVLGAEIVVQLDRQGNILNVNSDVLRDTDLLDEGDIGLTPLVDAAQAEVTARLAMAGVNKKLKSSDISLLESPELMVYAPELLDLNGPLRLVWRLPLQGVNAEAIEEEALFIDAHSGAKAFQYSLKRNALEREIIDQKRSFYEELAETVRTEGSLPTGIPDVDNVYQFLGDTYNYYLENHNRDSFDDRGTVLQATVRVPFLNAFARPYTGEMAFGLGFPTDDVVAHEYTHLVTHAIVDLLYFSQSGAIDEAYSDIFAEFVDLTNNLGDDAPEDRWFMGEDLPAEVAAQLSGGGGGLRYMKDPTLFGDPDRVGSPLFYDLIFDNAGVHTNNGVINKLCYLLTDGDSFNGFTIEGIGMEAAAELFFAARFLLTPTSDFADLSTALGASANSANYDFQQRLNISKAVRAVEIDPAADPNDPEPGLTNFRATPARDNAGNPVVVLTWDNPTGDDFIEVTLLRSVSGFVTEPQPQFTLENGVFDDYLDTDIEPGTEYFYTLVATMASGLPQVASTRVTGDAPVADPLSEPFGYDPTTGNNPAMDLENSQLLFTPVGPPLAPIGDIASNQAELGDYTATFIPGVSALPVPESDEDGTARYLPLTKNSVINVSPGDVPISFFGQTRSSLYLGANGYLAFTAVGSSANENFPSLASHFAVARISFLFGNMAPNLGGTVWTRTLDDRFVATFDGVPEAQQGASVGSTGGNTVQCELFYSGHIRITYLSLDIDSAVVGISDGRGTPQDPSEVFQGLESESVTSDLSGFPAASTMLSIEPVAPQFAFELSPIEFEVSTLPGNARPVLQAEWTRNDAAPFADNLDGTGVFSWTPQQGDEGTYIVRIIARTSVSTTYQDVFVTVGDSFFAPTAENLSLSSGVANEDPTTDRVVPTDRTLIADYVYVHPEAASNPDSFGEGNTLITWFRNNVTVPGLTNSRTVDPDFTGGNDRWFFTVTPVTASGVAGDEVISPIVTISGLPDIEAVVPSFGLVAGGQTVRIRGEFLNGPLSVKFGGVEATRVEVINDQELEVVTPPYVGSISVAPAEDFVDVVTVSVDTSQGTGVLNSGFTYKQEGTPEAGEDKGGAGCGGGSRLPTSRAGDMLFMVLAALSLILGTRQRARVRG